MTQDICVVVPARNEATVLGVTLCALVNAGILPENIFLVDDCSTDNTSEIGQVFGATVLRNDPNLGKAGAIARAVDVFKLDERFKYIALMDADTVVDDEYFVEMQKAFRDTSVVAACGRPKSRPFNWITAHRAYGYAYTHFVYRGAQSKMRVINVAPGCATVYRSSIWRKLVWSTDTVTEDMDVTIQIHKRHLGRIVYVPEAIVNTQDPKYLIEYGKQMLRWNTGMWQVVKKYQLYRLRSRIDWECTLLFGEGLIFSLLYLLVPLLMFYDLRFGYMVFLDALIVLVIALVLAKTEKRWDVFLSSPLFMLMRFYDAALFQLGFWKVVFRRTSQTWFSPSRYHQEDIQ